MRLYRPRFRLWVMMLAVAIVAVGLGVWKLRERSRAFVQMAAYHQREAQDAETMADLSQRSAKLTMSWIRMNEENRAAWLAEGNKDDGTWEKELAEDKKFEAKNRAESSQFKDLSAFHITMKQKYERAARHPWLAVGPDPPAPPHPWHKNSNRR